MDFRSGAQRVVKRTRPPSTREEERIGSCLQQTSTYHALHQVPIHTCPCPRSLWKPAGLATRTAVSAARLALRWCSCPIFPREWTTGTHSAPTVSPPTPPHSFST